MKFATKLTVIVLGIVLTLSGVATLVTYISCIRILETQIKGRLEDAAFHIMDKIDRALFERIADTRTLAGDTVLTSSSSSVERITTRLIDYRNSYKSFVSLSFYDPDRVRVADSSALKLNTQEPLEGYWKGLAGKKEPSMEVGESESLGTSVIRFAMPVQAENGSMRGFVVTRVPVSTMNSVLKASGDAQSAGEEIKLDLMDRNGLLLYSTYNREGILRDNLSKTEGFRRSLEGENLGSGISSGRTAGREIYVFVREPGYLDFRGNGWVLIACLPTAEAFAPVDALRDRMAVILAGALILSLAISWFFSRSVTKPVKAVQEAALQISQGILNGEIMVRSKDEIGSLARSFDRMKQAMQAMAGIAERIAGGDLSAGILPRSEQDVLGSALSTMQQNLKSQIMEVVDATNVLTSSTTQILASISQLSANAAETASSVSETTVTVEEVKQTAHLANQKAREVSENAQEAVAVSQRGREAMEKSRAQLNRIKDQMETIAGNILRLSEQSQAIGEIMMTVSDLSDQSNLLAVNAAIEASRAGVQGKGFTVVAQEIRSMAERSKKATVQVRGLLSEIQKATNAAVLSVEQGTKAMDDGLGQSDNVSEAIATLYHAVEAAARSSTHIAASSHQQLAGMDQVALAMENIKEASGQNMLSMKELETEVRNLAVLGQRLKAAVERYKVS